MIAAAAQLERCWPTMMSVQHRTTTIFLSLSHANRRRTAQSSYGTELSTISLDREGIPEPRNKLLVRVFQTMTVCAVCARVRSRSAHMFCAYIFFSFQQIKRTHKYFPLDVSDNAKKMKKKNKIVLKSNQSHITRRHFTANTRNK